MKRKAIASLLIFGLIVSLLPSFQSLTYAAKTALKMGQYIQFGKYNDEPILWRVIGDSGNTKADLGDVIKGDPLLLSDRILAIKPYDAGGNNTSGSHGRDSEQRAGYGSNFWADSDIRSWLNSSESAGNINWLCGNPPSKDKINSVYTSYVSGSNPYDNEKGFLADGNFTDEERKVIKEVTQKSVLSKIDADIKSGGTKVDEVTSLNAGDIAPVYAKAYYNKVSDKVFLLDIEHAENVFQNFNLYYTARPTEKCVENSEIKYEDLSQYKAFRYWLRTPYIENSIDVLSAKGGRYIEAIKAYDGYNGIRPALYLDAKSTTFISGKGTAANPYVLSGATSDKAHTIKTGTEVVKPIVTTTTIASGEYHSLAIKKDGTLWAWGSNGFGQIGNGSKSSIIKTPVKIMSNVYSIAAGKLHSLAIKKDGSLWAWGDNKNGQLGDGSKYKDSDIPSRDTPVKIMDNVKFIAAGDAHSLAVKKDGTLWAWGTNIAGQLGDGTSKNSRNKPIKIMENVASVAAFSGTSFALKTDGTLWGWGYCDSGELGDGGGIGDDFYRGLMGSKQWYRTSPIKVMDNVTSIAAGGHTLVIRSDKSLWGWGVDTDGQLGINQSEGFPFKLMDNVKAISAGFAHSLIVKDDGTLLTCGNNEFGQLGNGTKDESWEFTKIMNNVIAVTAANNNSMTLKNDGTLWAWGYNNVGQTGDGKDVDRSTPFKALTNVMIPSIIQ